MSLEIEPLSIVLLSCSDQAIFYRTAGFFFSLGGAGGAVFEAFIVKFISYYNEAC